MPKSGISTIEAERSGLKTAGASEHRRAGQPATGGGASAAFGAVEIVDVWSRTSPKYRRRAVLFLLASALLFCGLASFAFWIRTGEVLAPAVENYPQLLWDCFDWRSENPITLTDMLFYPISVRRVPMMLVIVGLTMGTLIAIPILVAILYRFPASLIFAGIVGFLSLMPWLAVNIVLMCRLATLRRIRMRYASALIGLLPMVVYFLLATRGAVVTQLAPAEQIKLYFPWIVAMIWASVLMGIVLGLARMVNYRPGVIAPLLAVSLAIPVVLFEGRVGRDELYYRLLERACGPRSARHFADVGKAAVIAGLAERRLAGSDGGRVELDEIKSRLERWWYLSPEEFSAEMTERQTGLSRSQYEISRACDRFLRDFSKSRYVPCALYLKARALDMRLDGETFRTEGEVRHYYDFPSAASRDPWIRLVNQYPLSALSSVGRLRLAVFRAQEGRIAEAIGLLEEVERMGERDGEEAGRSAALFGVEAPEASLGISVERSVVGARKLGDLLGRNRDAGQGDAPLALLMRMDSRHRKYDSNLSLLRSRYPEASLVDNIELARAMHPQSRQLRIWQLSRFVAGRKEGDALERALFELGSVYEEDSQPVRALEAFGRLVLEFPGTPWSSDAVQRAERIERYVGQGPRGE